MKNRKRNRLKGYDYSKNNLYFVTSCVQNMECCLGDVEGTGRDLSVHCANPNPNANPNHKNLKSAEMILNKYGIIVNNQLQWLERQYQYIILHSYVVMPNHIHAIIEIDSNNLKNGLEIQNENEVVKIKSLSQIIGAFKTTSSKLIRLAGYDSFSWQRSFHDHIIKNELAYYNISYYIENNPDSWFKDKFYK